MIFFKFQKKKMDRISRSTKSNSSITNKKSIKNKFTDLKNRIVKKKEEELAKSGKLKPISGEIQEKMTLDNAKILIDKELNNDKLLIKIIDNNAIYNSLDDFYYKSGDFDIKVSQKENENMNEVERNINENHSGFFNKFKNYKINCRKGLLKSITPSIGFIKASSELMIVPNPIGLISKNQEPTTLNLK
jgi:hypothetical protein